MIVKEHEAATSDAAKVETRDANGGRVAPYVLVVEDNSINQLIAQEFLATLGIRSSLAFDGEDALCSCEREAPDLVLMDIQMPGMDGLEATRQLRRLQQSGRMRHFPIIALTAFNQTGDVTASARAGMNEHLVKPIDFTLLLGTLARWIPLPRPQPETSANDSRL
jgi:CheY-like chemotaxis protein